MFFSILKFGDGLASHSHVTGNSFTNWYEIPVSERLHPCCNERRTWDLRPWMPKPPYARSQDWRVTFELPLLVFATVPHYIIQLFQRAIDINICTNNTDVCINIILVWETVWMVF